MKENAEKFRALDPAEVGVPASLSTEIERLMSLYPDRPHFAYPFTRGADGKIGVVEQDTLEHIDACANVIIRCPVGFRLERPEFGWPFPEFQTVPIDLGPLEGALTRFEPRATPTINQYADAAEAAAQHITIDERVEDGR